MSGTERFDQVAGSWDEDPGRVALARAVAEQIRQQVPLMPQMDVLDFGCGTGLLTLAVGAGEPGQGGRNLSFARGR
jgi:2-polyprenyl-3-methyl-5-hydroxy-6-metoxy-1,4-benzoquinol methylase